MIYVHEYIPFINATANDDRALSRRRVAEKAT